MGLSSSQRHTAKVLIKTGKKMHVPRRDIITALTTGLTEANLENPHYGDGTSVGWRQEISSYGSVADRTNIQKSAGRFYKELRGVGGGSVGSRAQQVQRSAFPSRYQPNVGKAREIYSKLAKGTSAAGSPSQGRSRSVTTKTPATNLQDTAAGRGAILNFLQNRDRPDALLNFLGEKRTLTSSATSTTKKVKIKGSKSSASSVGIPSGGKFSKKATHIVTHGQIVGDAIKIGTKVAHKFGLTVTATTGGNHVAGSYHYQGRAIDIAGSSSNMRKAFNFIRKNVPQSKLTELFYDPAGFYYDNGKKVRGAIGGHSDHVHFAV